MIKKFSAVLIITCTSLFMLAVPVKAAGVFADLLPSSVVCNSEQNSGTSTVCTDKVPDASNTPSTLDSFNPISGQNGILLNITNIVDYAVGVGSIIMVVVGSIRYIISNGDSNKITSAKSTIIYALVGVAVAAIARVLIYFVIDYLNF